jgi:cell division protein FtsW
MLYSATGKPIYAGLGIGGGAAASYIAYQLFSHVKTRVVVWLDPWSYIDNEGYQITQSLFGIGMGSWLGSGLFDGMPEKIPFVEKDFMFSAIAEEFGVVFAIGVILLCLNTVLLMLQAGMKLSEPFYRLLAVGFASVYGIQVFLTIGGGMNLIPITGVTLPLVSYGGSSAVSTLLMFAIVQGLNLIDEVDTVEKRKRKKSKTT